VLGLMEKDPSKRLTAEEVIKHPWVAKHCEEYEISMTSRHTNKYREFSSNNNRGRQVKALIAVDKFRRTARDLIRIGRWRESVDTLLKGVTESGLDIDLKTIIFKNLDDVRQFLWHSNTAQSTSSGEYDDSENT